VGKNFKVGHARFLPHPSRFQLIPRYVVCSVGMAALNKVKEKQLASANKKALGQENRFSA
jgi:hypothetical protein